MERVEKGGVVMMTRQTRRGSIIETIASTLTGLIIACIANWLILPFWGYHPKLVEAFNIGAVFTVISIARGYIFRRVFELLRINGKVL